MLSALILAQKVPYFSINFVSFLTSALVQLFQYEITILQLN